MSIVTVLILVVALAMLLPFRLVGRGPTVFDRMVGVNIIGTSTVLLLCLTGYAFGRLDMFIDIAIAYALLNFIGGIAVARYLDSSGGDAT